MNPVILGTSTLIEPQHKSLVDNRFLHYFLKTHIKKKREEGTKQHPCYSYCQKGQRKKCCRALCEHLPSAKPSSRFNNSITGSQSYKGHPKWIFFKIHLLKLKKKIAFTFQHFLFRGLLNVQVSKSLYK